MDDSGLDFLLYSTETRCISREVNPGMGGSFSNVVENQETLKTYALVGQFLDLVQRKVNDLLAYGARHRY